MTFTYTFLNAEKTHLLRDNHDGSFTTIAVNSGTTGWNEYVESGAVAAPYVAPPPLTTEEKLNNLLSDYGLSREELKTAIYEEESN